MAADLHGRITEAIRKGIRERRRPEVIAHAVLNITHPVDPNQENAPDAGRYARYEEITDG